MQIIIRNKWVIDLFTFHSFKGVTNWHATWAKVSLKRVRTPAVEPSLSCADQTKIRPLKSDNVNAQNPSHIREPWGIPDPWQGYEWPGCSRWGIWKSFWKELLSFLTQYGRMSVVGVDLKGVVRGVAHFESPRVSSTVGSSAHWMDGDHSLGGVCIPNIPRLWHVCVSVERDCSLHQWKQWQKG